MEPVNATAWQAGFVAGSTAMHAVRRTLAGHRTLCGATPERYGARFDEADVGACPMCQLLGASASTPTVITIPQQRTAAY